MFAPAKRAGAGPMRLFQNSVVHSNRIVLFLIGILFFACLPVVADPPVAAGKIKAPVFPEIFPQPTGQNGYEDIIAAADLIRENPLLDTATTPDATLAQKQAALSDPACQQALTRLRLGLTKPLQSPRQKGESSSNILHEMLYLGRLGKLLGVEEYVLAAAGRTGVAINSLQDAFHLTDAIRTDGNFPGLYAAHIDMDCLDVLACHMGQWSLYDCERILSLVQERLKAVADPGRVVLEGERRRELARLDEQLTYMESLNRSNVAQANLNGEESIETLNQSWLALGADTATHRAAFAEIRRQLNGYFDQVEERSPFLPDTTTSTENSPPIGEEVSGSTPKAVGPSVTDARIQTFVHAWFRVTLSDLSRIRTSFARYEVVLRLMGTHAMIRRYRWETGRLPTDLTRLPMLLTTDPYADAPFHYEVDSDGGGYTLSSVGPTTGHGAQHDPITLPANAALWK
jgi:hypothetical protein